MERANRAVVLAAGLGRRIGEDVPKTLLQVGGSSILRRSLTNLAAAGVSETVLVVGHFANQIRLTMGDAVGDMTLRYIESDAYRTTNNAYSLWLAREYLTCDTWLIEGDVVFEADLLDTLAGAEGDVVTAVSPYRPEMTGTVVELGRDNRVKAMILPSRQEPGRDLSRSYKTVNVHLLREDYLRNEFVPNLDALINAGGHDAYYELVIADTVAAGGYHVCAVDCGGLRWYEVDDQTDLAAAEYVFGRPESRLAMLQGLHGGYWRYDVVDHCLLYNMYFPPKQMVNDLAREFADALVHYPVGHRALQRLLGGVLGQPADRLVVANGASELIKILGRQPGRIGIVVPGFNEYEAVFDPENIHRIPLCQPGFRLNVARVIEQADQEHLTGVIVTSPNNPTSVAVPRSSLQALARGLARIGVRLLVDESFVEFCGPEQSLESELDDLRNVVIIKSMSKVYGVGGLRLGYLLSTDLAFVASIQVALPIWNVNGFAESFLRLLPRYRAEFLASCDRVRRDRDQLADLLRKLPGVTVDAPSANFVTVMLPEGWSAEDVVYRLFADHGILIKDCTGKSMPDGHRYLRISSRTPVENVRLVKALAATMATLVRPAAVGAEYR